MCRPGNCCVPRSFNVATCAVLAEYRAPWGNANTILIPCILCGYACVALSGASCIVGACPCGRPRGGAVTSHACPPEPQRKVYQRGRTVSCQHMFTRPHYSLKPRVECRGIPCGCPAKRMFDLADARHNRCPSQLKHNEQLIPPHTPKNLLSLTFFWYISYYQYDP